MHEIFFLQIQKTLILNNFPEPGDGEEHQTAAALLCVQCKDSFHNAWDLMVHAQAAHMLNIYELGVPQTSATDKSIDSPCQSPALGSPRPGSPDKVSILISGQFLTLQIYKRILTTFWQ